MLDLFFSGSDLTSQQGRAVVEDLLNMDWRSKRPTHACAIGHCLGRDDTISKIKTLLVPALLPHLFHIFARSRWTGAAQTFSDLGKGFAPHNIFGHAIVVMDKCVKEKREPEKADFEALLGKEDQEGWDDHDDGDDFLLSPLVDDMFLPADDAVVEYEEDKDPSKLAAGEARDFAKFNLRMRSKAVAFAGGPAPLLRLILSAVVLRPIMDMLHRAFSVCSKEFAQTAASAAMGSDEGKYRIIEIQRITSFFFADVCKLIDDSGPLSRALISTWRTSLIAATAFRMLARGAGAAHFLLDAAFFSYPYRLFDLVDDSLCERPRPTLK